MVLLGPPASGKGTQAEMIGQRLGIPSASPGAMLRAERMAGTELGLAAEKLTSAGQLLPNDIIVGLAKAWLRSHEESFVFDGFPRTIGQAEALETMLAECERPLELAILLEVTAETIAERVARRVVCAQCGAIFCVGWQVASAAEPCPACGGALSRRSDDDPATLRHRLAEYAEKTAPVIGFYERRDLLHRIDGSPAPDAVFAGIAEALR